MKDEFSELAAEIRETIGGVDTFSISKEVWLHSGEEELSAEQFKVALFRGSECHIAHGSSAKSAFAQALKKWKEFDPLSQLKEEAESLGYALVEQGKEESK